MKIYTWEHNCQIRNGTNKNKILLREWSKTPEDGFQLDECRGRCTDEVRESVNKYPLYYKVIPLSSAGPNEAWDDLQEYINNPDIVVFDVNYDMDRKTLFDACQ